MTFWQIFIRVFPWRPLPALVALWWHSTGRKLRARNRLRAAGGDLPFAYKFWIRNIEGADELKARTRANPRNGTSEPMFTVVIDAHRSSDEDVKKSIRSVEAQAYPRWELLVLHPPAKSNTPEDSKPKIVVSWRDLVRESIGEYIAPLLSGDQLSEWALIHFAEAVRAEPGAVILYGDEDEIDASARRQRPFFKPRWNKELFLARDYISRSCVMRTAAVKATLETLSGADPELIEILLNLVGDDTNGIAHIPKITTHLCNRHAFLDSPRIAEAVAKHVAPAGATTTQGPFGSIKIVWPLPDELPLVSIIVPTKDKVELLRACIESVCAQTAYPAFEILVVDNDSVEKQTLDYLETLRGQSGLRVLTYPGPYNYSAINNHAVREAKGSFICLLNNDTEVLGAEWLTEMMRYAVRPEIGAVGAKLLYADDTIQHAGVIVGIGDAAGHPHRNLPSHEQGYFCQAHLPQYVSAVTGACLLVDKNKYFAVGGLDEQHLPIAYNDVDLCLKLERAGWRNVYVPHAVLRHHESKSRAKDHSRGRIDAYRRELKLFQERWGADNYEDPMLNPNLDRSSETFVIRF